MGLWEDPDIDSFGRLNQPVERVRAPQRPTAALRVSREDLGDPMRARKFKDRINRIGGRPHLKVTAVRDDDRIDEQPRIDVRIESEHPIIANRPQCDVAIGRADCLIAVHRDDRPR